MSLLPRPSTAAPPPCVCVIMACCQIHTCLCSILPGFKHGAGDVEDACWQLLGELQLLLRSHEDRFYLSRVMEPVADRLPVYTPGPPYKVRALRCPE